MLVPEEGQGSFWKDRPVFVTGSTGLVGAWLIEGLLEKGANIVGLVRDHTPFSHLFTSRNHEKISLVRGDLSDLTDIERIMAEYEVDTVFHLAGQTVTRTANQSPLSTFETNIRGTWLVLEAARRTPAVQRLVVASSDTVYGDAELPYREEQPIDATFPYDVSKAAADMITRSYAKTFGLKTAVTRCANLYGGGDLNWSRLIPGTIRSVYRGESPIIRSDGRAQRDFLYIKDAIRGYMQIAEQLESPEIMGEPFNLASGQAVTVLDMVNTIIRHSTHPTMRPVVLHQTQSETSLKVDSIDKAGRLLNWTPQFSLDEGIAETVNWYSDLFQNTEGV